MTHLQSIAVAYGLTIIALVLEVLLLRRRRHRLQPAVASDPEART